MSRCHHLWGKNGICVKPGCMARPPAGVVVEPQRHPASTTTPERRAQVLEMLATHTIADIARTLRMSDRTVRRIRDESQLR